MEFQEKVKNSFKKVSEDINLLQEELSLIRKELEEIKANFILKSSTGNKGVSTDRQTDTQTFDTPPFLVDENHSRDFDTSTHLSTHSSTHPQHIPEKLRHIPQKDPEIPDLTSLMNSLKSDLKKRFKSLTKQEFYIFSILFTVDKTQDSVTYKDIAKRTGLTSSSIRDYIQRIISKGIPIYKEKLNNKVTILKIPAELRNLATLDNLMRLRNSLENGNLDSFTKK